MRCFVSGANGFVGGQLVGRLLEEGHRIIALVYDEESATRLRALDVIAAVGVPEDLDPSFKRTLDGVDVAFHCDAYLDPQGHAEIFRQVNVVGTRRLLDAAVAANVKRLVFLSSQAVAWDGQELIDADEGAIYPAEHPDPYSETRAEAERIVLGASRAGRIEAVAVRPGWTWGPGDDVILPLLMRRALKGGSPLVGDGEFLTATTYITHLVDALMLASQRSDVAGKAYFVSDDMGLTCRGFIDLQLGAVGLVPHYRHIPGLVARAAAVVVQAAGPLIGASSPLARLIVGMAAGELTHNVRPAREELGFVPRVSLDEGLAQLTAWAQSVGGVEAVASLIPSRSNSEND